MKMKALLFIIIITAVAFGNFNALAQEKQQKQEKDKKTSVPQITAEEKKLEEKPGGGTDLEAGMDADSETEIDSGEFVYRPKGRRDPFFDLLLGKSTKMKKDVKEGIEGLEIEQLELEGIVSRNGKYIALFKGPDSKPYDVQVGQSVYDGEIIEINANSVVFKKVLTIALGGTKEKTVIKWLNPEKEKEQ